MKVKLKYEINDNLDIICNVYDEAGDYICLGISKDEETAKKHAIRILKSKFVKYYKEEELEVKINQPIQGRSNG